MRSLDAGSRCLFHLVRDGVFHRLNIYSFENPNEPFFFYF